MLCSWIRSGARPSFWAAACVRDCRWVWPLPSLHTSLLALGQQSWAPPTAACLCTALNFTLLLLQILIWHLGPANALTRTPLLLKILISQPPGPPVSKHHVPSLGSGLLSACKPQLARAWRTSGCGRDPEGRTETIIHFIKKVSC